MHKVTSLFITHRLSWSYEQVMNIKKQAISLAEIYSYEHFHSAQRRRRISIKLLIIRQSIKILYVDKNDKNDYNPTQTSTKNEE